MNSVWKVIGLVITLISLGIKVFYTVFYYDDVMMEWGTILYVFWAVYLVHLIALVAPFTKGTACLIISMMASTASMLLLMLDGIILIAKLAEEDGRTMTEMGYFPLAYIMICIASAFNIVGSINDKKREKEQIMIR